MTKKNEGVKFPHAPPHVEGDYAWIRLCDQWIMVPKASTKPFKALERKVQKLSTWCQKWMPRHG